MLISLFRVFSWFDTIYNIVTRWVSLRENHLHEHEPQLSDCNILKYFDPNIVYFWYYLQFFKLTVKKNHKQNCKYIIFLPEICTFGRKYF